LISCAESLYVFLNEDEMLGFYEVAFSAGSPELRQLVSQPNPRTTGLEEHGGLLAAPLPCTCVSVQGFSSSEKCLAASSGHGDISLLTFKDGAWSSSNAVFPVVPAPPLRGVHPFMLRAAFQPSPGIVRVVLMSVLDKTETAEAGCEVLVSDLGVAGDSGGGGTLSVAAGAARAYVSPLPPHATLVKAESSPPGGLLLLAVTPGHSLQSKESDDHALGGRAPEHPGLGLHDGEDGGSQGSAPEPAAAAAAAPAPLEHMTSESQEDPPQYQPADIFKEGGPEGLGEMGSEPACELLLLNLESPAAPKCADQMPLAPHCVLTSQMGLPGLGESKAVIGVTDDVDCALLHISVDGEADSLHVKHVSTVPALAYIAAGKQQKKFLLVSGSAGSSGASPCAALVEASKYVYVYGRARLNATHGSQQVVDLEAAEPGSTAAGPIQGARLWEHNGTHYLLLLRERHLTIFEVHA